MSSSRQNFIDWLKALGMFLIVFGHVFGPPFNQLTQPIYPKQLGVAIFIFIMGWGLSRETRPKWRVAWNRLFPIFFWGIAFAVLMSLVKFFLENDLNLSNYMPFVLGVNVFVDYFPANPTTWYIGTYFHIILIWALLFRRIRVTPVILGIGLLLEIIIRAAIIRTGHLYSAYMLLPNWITLFLMGIYLKDRQDVSSGKHLSWLIAGWGLFVLLWAMGFNSLHAGPEFPFRSIPMLSGMPGALAVSVSVSVLYLFHTAMFFAVFRRIPAGPIVRFFSRNTIIIFIAHMPVLYALSPWVYDIIPNPWLKKGVMVAIMYVGLAVVSEGMRRVVPMDILREVGWRLIQRFVKRDLMVNGE